MSFQRVMPHVLPAGDAVEQQFNLHLDPLPRLVGEARAFVTSHAPPLPPDTHDALLLLTSELVTNAVLHARTPLNVGITVSAGAIVVTVHDLDLARSEQQPHQTREGGWGLGLIAALAEEWAIEPHADGGKTAWFRLPRGESPHVGDDAAQRDEDAAARQR